MPICCQERLEKGRTMQRGIRFPWTLRLSDSFLMLNSVYVKLEGSWYKRQRKLPSALETCHNIRSRRCGGSWIKVSRFGVSWCFGYHWSRYMDKRAWSSFWIQYYLLHCHTLTEKRKWHHNILNIVTCLKLNLAVFYFQDARFGLNFRIFCGRTTCIWKTRMNRSLWTLLLIKRVYDDLIR